MGRAGQDRRLDRPHAQLDSGVDLGVSLVARDPAPRRRVGGAGRSAARHPTRRATRGVTDEASPPDEEGGRSPAALGCPTAEKATAAVATASGDEDAPARKRRRRGGRGRKRPAGYEAVLDTGEEGYGFWLDGAVRDDPVFAEHWAGVRALSVRVEADQIVIRADDRG